MATEWFYTSKGQKAGPVSSQELKRLAKQGVLLPTDLLWKEGMKDWLPASKAKNLFTDEPSGVGTDSAGQQPPPQDSLQTSEPAHATDAPVTLGARMQNAARATALKAEQAKLTNVSLPAAYLALGRHLYAGRFMAEGFPDLYRELDGLQAQVDAATKRAAEATGTNLSEKAKALATKAAELAKVKAAEVQQLSLLKRLGEAASADDAPEPLPHEQLSDLVRIRNRISSIQDALASASGLPLAASDVSPSTGVTLSPRNKSIKLIGGIVAALCLIGFLARGKKDSDLKDNTHPPADSTQASTADENNQDFRDGYQAGLESNSMSPQEKGLFLSSVEQQIPLKSDPKAFRRGMAKAFRGEPATWASDANQSNGATTNTQTASSDNDQSPTARADAEHRTQDDTKFTVNHEGKTEVRTWHYDNGKPMKEIRFKGDKADGLARAWHDNGKPAWELTYRNGVGEGPHKVWWPTGELQIQETLRAGKSEGAYKEWDEKGVLIKDGEKKNDGWTKTLYIYWPNGKRSMECEYKDGKRNGRLKDWDKQGNLIEVSYWKDGIQEGRCQKWSTSGKALSDRNYTAGVADRSKVMSALIRSHEADGYTVTQVSKADLELAGKILDHAVAVKRDGQGHRVLCFLEAEAFDSSGANYFTLVELTTVVHKILVTAAWKGPVAEQVIRGADATYTGIIVIGRDKALLSLSAPKKNQPSTDFSQMRVGKEVFSVGGEVRSLPFTAEQQKEITDFLTAGTGG